MTTAKLTWVREEAGRYATSDGIWRIERGQGTSGWKLFRHKGTPQQEWYWENTLADAKQRAERMREGRP